MGAGEPHRQGKIRAKRPIYSPRPSIGQLETRLGRTSAESMYDVPKQMSDRFVVNASSSSGNATSAKLHRNGEEAFFNVDSTDYLPVRS